MAVDPERTFKPINIALLTVSDTRTAADDRSGNTLAELATEKRLSKTARWLAAHPAASQ